MAPPDDHTLLREWTARRSERAFRVLVERYAGLVHGTALRRLRRTDWAAEAAQDAFVLLARKASRLSGTSLGAWLHRAALHTSSALLKKETRHAQRVTRWAEQEALPGGTTEAPPGPELDDALNALPEADRALLVLRYFENRTAAEAGRRLGLSAEAAQKRTERALHRLAGVLHRRAPSLVPAAVATGLSAQLGKAAPQGLTAAVMPQLLALSGTVPATGFFYALSLMKASHAAIAAALLALLPAGYLYTQNQELRAELAARPKASILPSLATASKEKTLPGRGVTTTSAATAAAARPVAWDSLTENDKVTVELSRDIILRSDIPALSNYTKFTLSDAARELLRISDAEAAAVESSLQACEEELRKIERSKIKRIEELPNGVVFEIPAFPAEGKPLRDKLFAEVTSAVGERRAGFLLPKIAQTTDWRLGRFGVMKRRYRVEFQQDQPVIEADGTQRSAELLTTRIDYERGDTLDHSQIMEHDGPILAPVATKTKGVHVVIGEAGREDAVMISPELSHLFTVEELRK